MCLPIPVRYVFEVLLRSWLCWIRWRGWHSVTLSTASLSCQLSCRATLLPSTSPIAAWVMKSVSTTSLKARRLVDSSTSFWKYWYQISSGIGQWLHYTTRESCSVVFWHFLQWSSCRACIRAWNSSLIIVHFTFCISLHEPFLCYSEEHWVKSSIFFPLLSY